MHGTIRLLTTKISAQRSASPASHRTLMIRIRLIARPLNAIVRLRPHGRRALSQRDSYPGSLSSSVVTNL